MKYYWEVVGAIMGVLIALLITTQRCPAFDLYHGGELPRVTHTDRSELKKMNIGWMVIMFAVGIGVGFFVHRREQGKAPIPDSWKPRVVEEKKRKEY